jgi:hypothetical protein
VLCFQEKLLSALFDQLVGKFHQRLWFCSCIYNVFRNCNLLISTKRYYDLTVDPETCTFWVPNELKLHQKTNITVVRTWHIKSLITSFIIKRLWIEVIIWHRFVMLPLQNPPLCNV